MPPTGWCHPADASGSQARQRGRGGRGSRSPSAPPRRDLDALGVAGLPTYSRQGRNGGWELAGGGRTDLSGLALGAMLEVLDPTEVQESLAAIADELAGLYGDRR